MSTVAYSDFVESVAAMCFPDREAENLVVTHRGYIDEALINLQTYVPCMRSNNVTFFEKGDMQEWCNADFFYGDRGVIHAVYAFKPGTDCKRYFYVNKSIPFVQQWMSRQACVACPDEEDDISRSPDCHTVAYGDDVCEGLSEEEDDSRFKCTSRFYGVGPNQKIFLCPRIPCGYQVAVHWEGIKQTFENTDPLPDDRDLLTAVTKYVNGQVALFLDKDQALYDRIMHPKIGEFTNARADIIHRCSMERQIRDRFESLENFDILNPFIYDPLPTDSSPPPGGGSSGGGGSSVQEVFSVTSDPPTIEPDGDDAIAYNRNSGKIWIWTNSGWEKVLN